MVLLNVLAGGMRSITFVQAFQYWLKLTALLVPLAFLVLVWLGDGGRSPADPSLLVRRRVRYAPGPTRSTSPATTRCTRRTP